MSPAQIVMPWLTTLSESPRERFTDHARADDSVFICGSYPSM
jgi:hypothetical protein